MKKFLLPLILTLTISSIACFAGCTSSQSSRSRTQPNTDVQRDATTDEVPDTDIALPDDFEAPNEGFAPRRPFGHGHRRATHEGGMHREGQLPPPPAMNDGDEGLMRYDEVDEDEGGEDDKCEKNSPKPAPRRRKNKKPAPAPDGGESENAKSAALRKPTPKPMPKPVEPIN